MSSKYIIEREMLTAMERGKPFSITFVSYDKTRKTGGKIYTLPEVVLLHKKKEAAAAAARPLTPAEARAIDERESQERRANPNHRSWYTRNVRVLQDGHPTEITRKIHPPLVLLFNGKRVVP